MATATIPLTVPVDAETAKAFEAASAEDREKAQAALGLALQELFAAPSGPAGQVADGDEPRGEAPESPANLEEWRERLQRVHGIWKDRDDLPSLEELRAEWDRF